MSVAPPASDKDLHRELRLLAERAARLGGDIARDMFGREMDVQLKHDRSEVTEADLAVQDAIVTFIHRQRPRDGFIMEESTARDDVPALPRPANDQPCWVIDPIDGTRNYVRHIPVFCCSVGVMCGGRPIAGAIHEPLRNVMYSGSAAEGMFIDNAVCTPHEPQVLAGQRRRPLAALPSRPDAAYLALARDWLGRYICRNLGSTALHFALVAAGEIDLLLADNPRLWDLAAGVVLCDATGRVVSTPEGRPLFPVDVTTYRGSRMPTIAARAELHANVVRAAP